MLNPVLIGIIVIIGVALSFDFVNGFHDAANSIATVVSTRVLTPIQGVVWAAVFNFIAAFTFGTAVAKTIGDGLVDVNKIDNLVIFCALIGAISWDIITWILGLPTSSSHALIGGYAGAAIVKAGFGVLIIQGWIKTVSFIFIAPLLGYGLGWIFMTAIYWAFRKSSPARVDHLFRRGQLVSAALYSLGHGTNDAQKTMGVIASVLFTVPVYRHLVSDASGHLTIPFWIVIMAYTAIALGTLSGGWRIVHTMGSKITKLKPMGGFAAEISRRGDHFFGFPLWHPRFDDPHDCRGHRWRRFGAGQARRSLGRRQAHRLCLGPDDPRCGGYRRPRLFLNL